MRLLYDSVWWLRDLYERGCMDREAVSFITIRASVLSHCLNYYPCRLPVYTNMSTCNTALGHRARLAVHPPNSPLKRPGYVWLRSRRNIGP
jgi:hypothetical protein